MGQTLSNTAVWTSARESGESKLENTPINQDILDDIITFTENFPGTHADLVDFTFQKPLTWTTQLKPADLSGAFSQKGDETVSDAQDKSGQAYCTLSKKGSTYEISVYSMEYAAIVLKSSGKSKSINECRACLEANRDPTANILGDRFAHVSGTDSADYRFVADLIKAKKTTDQEEDGQDSKEDKDEENMKQLKILFIIRDFDKKLLEKCIKKIAEEIRLTSQDVDRTVKLLARYSGPDEDHNALEYIGWPELYSNVYDNGCRAPPWRQLHGDISYIKVKIHDPKNEGDIIYITASTNGYYVSEDFYENFILHKDDEQQNAEKDQKPTYYKDLIQLLRELSPRFNDLIDKQEYFKRTEETGKGIMDTTDDTTQQDQDQTKGDTTQRSEKRDHRDRSEGEKKKKGQPKKKLEPSLKWRILNVEEEKEEERQQKKVYQKKKEPKSSKAAPSSDAEDSFVESESESEEEEETVDRRSDNNTDLPSEYWQIQKLVKYLKGGNQTATIIALCSMRDFNLQQETCQLAIRDVGGLEVLINLLDTEEIKCKIGALKILKEISKNTQIRRAIADLGGLQTMVKILRSPNKELKCLAAETIANVAKFRRARRTVRQHGGIKKTVALLDCAPIGSVMSADQEKDVEVARSGALALWSCSKSTLNKQAMRKAGAIPLLAKLLKSPHENMLIPVVGTLQECATENSYRLAIRTEGMVEDLVKNLRSENPELQMHCASAIFKCAEEKETRDLVRQYGGLDPLVTLLNNQEDKELLAAATGAIWKCSISPENVVRFKELKAIELLVQLLNNQPEEVLVNVVGALAELAKDTANRLTIRKAGGIPPLVNLLTGTNQALLVNVTKAVGQCAEEPDNMTVIDKLDGVRLLWSLLKNQNKDVQASAAWAICPCIENAKDAGEMVRSFVGGLELIVGLLECDDKEVLASVCAAIANIANDEENLAVITDHGVVPKLAVLTNTPEDKLRRHLAEAIARCCNWGNNRVAFGQENAVAPLVKYLRSKDKDVHRSTARALHQLSKDPDNCITMHEAGVVKPLMEMVGSEDDVLQEAAAGCISNIRRLALANEKARSK